MLACSISVSQPLTTALIERTHVVLDGTTQTRGSFRQEYPDQLHNYRSYFKHRSDPPAMGAHCELPLWHMDINHGSYAFILTQQPLIRHNYQIKRIIYILLDPQLVDVDVLRNLVPAALTGCKNHFLGVVPT